MTTEKKDKNQPAASTANQKDREDVSASVAVRFPTGSNAAVASLTLISNGTLLPETYPISISASASENCAVGDGHASIDVKVGSPFYSVVVGWVMS